MNLIKRKLRSQSGASMLIAMVFMMFCVFIGGSVLASASANGYRVAHLSDQQDFLSQRSAALLISDELQGSYTNRLRLTISDVDLTAREVEVLNGGGIRYTGNSKAVRTITFQAPSNLVMTPFQRVAFETTVWQYLKTNKLAPSGAAATGYTPVEVELKNFVYSDGSVDPNTHELVKVNIDSLSDFWLQYTLSDTLEVKGAINITSSDVPIAQIPAQYESCEDARLYDFAVSFGDYSQMIVSMSASYGERNPVELTKITTYDDGTTEYDAAEVYTKTRKPVISWDYPLIEKGGV